ncbi:N-acetylmuramoyl-L-alanine amidase [Amphritea sp. 2_MG-2023]|uniref:N-acetylmuramoyl-L-alanine amidase family protein n=1 Tax=Amphritea TaxID=515417 RepID=UPI001C06774E|nr:MULTISPECIES: N-acetylmuramoyl-L-alanine amidase [Amphritea]MBU2967256.1 N-acetylmuramoyl-L-alanine amidase [Amphritea atlantica]MDO6419246.1 N-acetylmuramoyl-L-alanine amidase [Amphritea sp. 2_MG-2023]
MMQRFWLLVLLLTGGFGTVSAYAAEVHNVRVWIAPDHARLVFDLSSAVQHKLFTLKKPDRIVLDMSGATLESNLASVDLSNSPISLMRSGSRNGGKDLRIVLELNEHVKPKSFALKPNDQYGDRLVVDLYRDVAEAPAKTAVASVNDPSARRDIIIAIDAGHGGEDPGAIGPGRVKEKTVVLGIARELKALLDKERGFQPKLTRDGDYYISLRSRTERARKMNADMFVSIHADGFRDHRAKGASVWVLSPRGASSEMGRWLAQKENSADLIGGVGSVSLEDKDEVLAKVLLDMSMTASLSDSRDIAHSIHRNMSKFAKMHKKQVEQAGFVVLKSPDIPSILVETGFITNHDEAAKLKSKAYQRKMAQAVFAGIKAHFTAKPPALTWLAWKKEGANGALASSSYKVVRGDTLSVIASRNGVSLAALRKANGLRSADHIMIGQVLKIPAS